ncbi:GTP 3',8-cyclase MoaA [Alkalilimnicola ehrlichii]|uniref:GTP 3',8-cyclase n=1 Tax=Alkalilimnicola ehrlichii TaxID=351052 RepID=A0A3E0WX97_9GAMM|nr:GTP 3',8-cyclase MoaA [Alkalilimnicola ehrlichii]RFA29956.1 GTP 3',8-cyclase MoaA [Alkalilimnicola ehrlichii]RFA36547.1 GTP 3',8-cyclase MoaA [Alkalilimnicola ehrlichii]
MPSPALSALQQAGGPVNSGPLVDRFGRSKKKLRLSLTDRCNFRCGYCMPADPVWRPKDEILSLDELTALAELFVERLGIEQIRLTGGEPLLRRDILRLVEALDTLRSKGLRRISLTTNGTLLARYAQSLKQYGIDDVNVSLDSLSPQRFAAMTGGGQIGPVLDGILAARDAGLSIKLNSVVIKGENEDEVVPLTEWAMGENIPLRFIEFMPLDGRGAWRPERVVTEAEILNRIRALHRAALLPRTREPATRYLIDDHYPLGIISTVSNPFCASCDRVRVTAGGELYPCLFSPVCSDLKPCLREGSPTQLEQRIRGAIWQKGRGFSVTSAAVARPISMHGLGG